MAESDLKKAIQDVLVTEGNYGKLKAEMRALVFNALLTKEDNGVVEQSSEINILNEIVREYLIRTECKFANAVFEQEAGLTPNTPCTSRRQILEELGLEDTEDSAKIPILAAIVELLKQNQLAT